MIGRWLKVVNQIYKAGPHTEVVLKRQIAIS